MTDKDNYLDMLTDRLGDFQLALDYLKDCALSDLTGDCKLIDRIYQQNNTNQVPSYTTNKKRTMVYYRNQTNQPIVENKEAFVRKIANNLQNSYLKGVNHLINQTLDQRCNPNKLLDDYDLLAWNQHIYNLSDVSYQKKLINQMEIPLKKMGDTS